MGNRLAAKAKKRAEKKKKKKGLHHHPMFEPIWNQFRHNMGKHQELVKLVQTLTLHNQALAELLVENTEVTHEQFQGKCEEVRLRFFPEEKTDEPNTDADSDEPSDRTDSSLSDGSEDHGGAEVEDSGEDSGRDAD